MHVHPISEQSTPRPWRYYTPKEAGETITPSVVGLEFFFYLSNRWL